MRFWLPSPSDRRRGWTLADTPINPTPPRLALRPKEAARALGIGERKLWEITADRTSGIPHVRLGRAIVYPTRDLAEWLAQRAKGGQP